MLGQKQSLLAPRFCRRCGGSLVRTATGYRCADCGTTREPIVTSREFSIVRPSQRATTLVAVPMARPRPGRLRQIIAAVGTWTIRFVAWAPPQVLRGATSAAVILRHGIARAGELLSASARWAYAHALTAVVLGRRWGGERIAASRATWRDIADNDWQLSRSVPGLGSSVVPLVILAVAVALALGLGGVIAAALS